MLILENDYLALDRGNTSILSSVQHPHRRDDPRLIVLTLKELDRIRDYPYIPKAFIFLLLLINRVHVNI